MIGESFSHNSAGSSHPNLFREKELLIYNVLMQHARGVFLKGNSEFEECEEKYFLMYKI